MDSGIQQALTCFLDPKKPPSFESETRSENASLLAKLIILCVGPWLVRGDHFMRTRDVVCTVSCRCCPRLCWPFLMVVSVPLWQVKTPLYGCDCYAYGLLAAGYTDLVVESGLKVKESLLSQLNRFTRLSLCLSLMFFLKWLLAFLLDEHGRQWECGQCRRCHCRCPLLFLMPESVTQNMLLPMSRILINLLQIVAAIWFPGSCPSDWRRWRIHNGLGRKEPEVLAQLRLPICRWVFRWGSSLVRSSLI